MNILIGSLLAFSFWTLFVLCFCIGGYRWTLVFRGLASVRQWRADQPQGSDWYQRAMRAHANCVENLPVFGAIIVAATLSGASSASLDFLALIVVVARIAQSVVHITLDQTEPVAVARFAFFFVQVVAMMWMAVLVASGLV